MLHSLATQQIGMPGEAMLARRKADNGCARRERSGDPDLGIFDDDGTSDVHPEALRRVKYAYANVSFPRTPTDPTSVLPAISVA